MSQISFSITNGTAANTIYMPTTDPGVNKLALLISSDTTLSLTPGTLQPENQGQGGQGTLFYLHLANLGLSPSELEGLKVTMAGWSTQVFAEDKTVCFTPDAPVTLSKGQNLTAQIENFVAATAPSQSTAQLYMNFFRAGPVSSGGMPFTYNNIVSLQAPPTGALDLHDVLAASLPSSIVVQSTPDYPSIDNALNLVFSPGPKPKVVNAGPSTIFTIGFVYADDDYGYGALTSLAKAFDIQVTAGDGAAGWVITPPPTASQNPAWMLQPTNGQPLLGTSGTVGFSLGDIVTTFQPGATLMVISYSGVPGYQDGAFSIPLYKEAHVYIHSLLATPNPAVLDGGKAAITLSWSASATRLTLMPGSIDVSGLQKYPTTISESTQFSLLAQGDSQQNHASRDVQVDILPVINSIVAAPQNVYYKDFPHDVLLDWSVDTNDQIELLDSVNQTPEYLPANYTTGKSISSPRMFTVVPDTDGLPLTIERSKVISAFELTRSSAPLSAVPVDLALSPSANLCAVAQQGSDQIQILETLTNTSYGTPVSVGGQPVAIAFSGDGSKLYVASANSTLSVFDVRFSSAQSGYSFTLIGSPVTLSGPPVALDSSADGSLIFVTTNDVNNTSHPGALDVIAKPAGTYVNKSTVRFTSQVSAVAALPSSAQIFALSASAQSLFVVGYDSIHQSFQWVRSIDGFSADDQLQDVAIAGQDSGTLLISCAGTNRVYAVGKDTSSVSGKQTLQVGSAPGRVMVIDSGAYAYVANTGDATLSLLACFRGSGFCSVLEQKLSNGATPVALSSSARGSVVYVANSDKTLSVWNANTFAPQQSPVNSVNQVTSVAASQQFVVSWHNYNNQFGGGGGGSPTPGLSVYDRGSQTNTLVNETVQYTTFAFWPDGAQPIAVATVFTDSNLYILDATTFATKTTVPLSSSPGRRAIATTISPFGNMIFALTSEKGAYQLVAISAVNGVYTPVSTVDLFTQSASSSHALAAVTDGSQAFITDGASRKLYLVSGGAGGYSLSGTSYDFPLLPRAMQCSPDDTFLYVWMNESQSSGFSLFDISAKVLDNILLPTTVQLQIAGMAISPDGDYLYVTDTNLGGVRVFSTDSMQPVQDVVMPGASFPMGVAVAPDGSGLYTANVFSNNISLAPQLAAQPANQAMLAARATLSQGAEYQGIFLRDYIGETPYNGTGSGWTYSPDIAPWGTSVMNDPSVLGQQANYNTDYSNNITLGQYNNVYVRGLNTNAGAQTSRVYFYWSDSSVVLLPSQWQGANFTMGLNVQNWLDLTASAQNVIAYSPQPISWQPPTYYPHYCLIAWVDNSADPVPPDLGEWANFQSWDDLGNFIEAHPNMAWRNTNDVAAPGVFMNSQTRLQGVPDGGEVTVGVKMTSIPNGGTIQFTLVNSDGTINYNSPVHTIDTNTFSQTLDWPPNAPAPMMTYTYYPAQGQGLQGGEQITAFTAWMPPMVMKKRLLLRSPHLLMEIRRGTYAVQEMVLGTVKFNYKP